ncbi:hypothetical protein [Halomonas halocynthiae]|uniref:hypothetical protein n=1 Tax=Halomonas halocynthiae TaxID=176290 RepID=UPI0003FC87D6|nr:hypothetical protein [Halomonas halocynthiae]
MAEHSELSPKARPIVPDPQASLSQRPYRFQRPRLWPLWLLCCVLLATLSSLAAYGWWYSQQLEQQLETMQGELSNLVAQQAGERESERQYNDEISRLAARFDRFESEQGRYSEDVEARLASVAQAFDSVEARIQQRRDDSEHEGAVSASLDRRISAIQTSLAAFEKISKEHRDTLAAEQQTLRQRQRTQQQQISGLQESVSNHLDPVIERMPDYQKQQENMAEHIDAIQTQLNERLTRGEQQVQRLDALAQQVREMRQTQLVINAQLEGMAQ